MRRSSLYLALFATTTILSCTKINEEIQRDLSIPGEASSFNTPILTNIEDQVSLAVITVNPNLNTLIPAGDSQFSFEDLQSAKITEIKLTFSNADTTSNLANFTALTVDIEANGQAKRTVANRVSNNDVDANSITLALTNATYDYRDYLTGTSVKYSISGLLRRPTEKVLSTKITPRYLVTLAR